MSGLIFWVSAFIFWVSDLYVGCLDLYFDCLDLYSGLWTYILGSDLICLGLWTYTSGVRVGSDQIERVRRVGRPGRVSSTFGEKSILGICIRKKKVSIDYIIEFWTWGNFTKKTRAEKCCIFAVLSRRDLSYETDSGPQTKTDDWSRKSVRFLKRVLIIWVVSEAIF